MDGLINTSHHTLESEDLESYSMGQEISLRLIRCLFDSSNSGEKKTFQVKEAVPVE